LDNLLAVSAHFGKGASWCKPVSEEKRGRAGDPRADTKLARELDVKDTIFAIESMSANSTRGCHIQKSRHHAKHT
jgi:hypothetical protein